MIMRNWIGCMAAAILMVTVASPASATIIFQDDFNRDNNNTVGNDWSEIEDETNDTAIRSSTLRLRDFKDKTDSADGQGIVDAAAGQLAGFNTVGFTNIILMYDWAATDNTESNDTLWVQWKLGTDALWNTLVAQALGGSGFAPESFGLGIGAEGVSNLQIRFATDVSTYKEAAFIDNVKLTGYYPTRVPEPSTLMLMGIGLVGLGWMGRKKKRSQ